MALLALWRRNYVAHTVINRQGLLSPTSALITPPTNQKPNRYPLRQSFLCRRFIRGFFWDQHPGKERKAEGREGRGEKEAG